MNQRQKKKKLKKIVNLLNEIKVVDFDGQGNELIYVVAMYNPKNDAILRKICKLSGSGEDTIFKMIDPTLHIMNHGWDVGIDLTEIWYLIKSWPKRWDIGYSSNKGFVMIKDGEK